MPSPTEVKARAASGGQSRSRTNPSSGFRISIGRRMSRNGRQVNFFHPDYKYINNCAYFDYQRERVYVRTSKHAEEEAEGTNEGQ